MTKISTMMFFPNGNFAAFDRKGEQVTEEQGSAWIRILQDKLDRGVITEETKVTMSGWENYNHKSGYDWTVKELIESKRLTRKKKKAECDRKGAKDAE